MISSLIVRNFGCFDDHDYKITFKGLNIIVGTNNSGKSTLFKGLNLIREVTKNGGRITWDTKYYKL